MSHVLLGYTLIISCAQQKCFNFYK